MDMKAANGAADFKMIINHHLKNKNKQSMLRLARILLKIEE